jgi:PIN domain nuclease of toxin-antitoxin system
LILYWVQYPDACVVIPAKAGIQNLDASVRWHDKYLAACSEDYLFSETSLIHLQHLPLHHHDPFDRMLICQTVHEKCTLVTSDALIRRYDIQVL